VLGYEADELLGKKATAMLSADKSDVAEKRLDDILRSKSAGKFVHRIVTKSGEIKTLEVCVRPILKDSQLVSFQSASRDVTEKEHLLAELKQSLENETEIQKLRLKLKDIMERYFVQ
jgi:PAS domain S-box-containing protein